MMIATREWESVLVRVAEVRRRCPDMRLGQLMAIIGSLAEDETGRSLWDIDDEEFFAALERFATDLAGQGEGSG